MTPLSRVRSAVRRLTGAGEIVWSRSHVMPPLPGCTWWVSNTGCRAIASLDDGVWHVSVSHPRRLPSWDEMRTARAWMTPDDVTMAFVLPPPRAEYGNVHETCLHMWQIDTQTEEGQ